MITEHIAKRPPHRAGFRAMLSALLRAEGSSTRSIRQVGSLLLCAVTFVALVPAVASAKQERLYAGTLGAATSTPANPYPLKSAGGIAVDDATHDIYVTDDSETSNGEPINRIEKFDSSGHFILMFGKGVNKTKINETGSSEAEQDVCTAASGDTCQGGTRGKSFTHYTPLEQPMSIAVDNSEGPSQGDVYVANGEQQATGLVDKFDASGHLIAGWASAGQFDGSTATSPPAPIAGPFGVIQSIAVDVSGNLWVDSQGGAYASSSGLFEFRQDASFITDWQALGSDFALDSEDNVYLANGVITKYDAAGHEIGVVAPSKVEGEMYGQSADSFRYVAIDLSNNELYGGHVESPFGFGNGLQVIRRYESSCHPIITHEVPEPGCASAEAFGAGLLHEGFSALAIDPSTALHSLYVAEREEVASFFIETVPDVKTGEPVSATDESATLTATVNPAGVELNSGLQGCRFEYVQAAQYEPAAANPYAAGHTVGCDKTAAAIGKENEPVEVQAEITGLQAGHTYHYRLVASNPNDVNANIDQPSFGADLAFGPPLLESESSVNVTATSATLQAAVDPNGIATSVHIEYGPEAGVYDGLTEVDAGAGGSSQSSAAHIQSLVPGTTYHYRAVAINSLGMSFGEDNTFTTQAFGVFALPDGRAWEQVSPQDKRGALLQPLTGGELAQSSADGDAFTYLGSAPTEPLPPGNSNYTQILSTRGEASAAAWGSRDIATPREVANGANEAGDEEYRFFSIDLSLGVAQPFGSFDPSLSAEASERTPFLRSNYVGGDPTELCTASCYRPLVTGAPGFANVPEGVEFGTGECHGEEQCTPQFEGASPDGEHIVLHSNSAGLTEGAPADSLYEWAGGRLQPVSVLPGGEPTPTGSEPALGNGRKNAGGAVSEDGSRIVWSSTSGGQQDLYVRDVTREETVALGGKEARFQAASADGSRVLFTQGGDLYVFEAPLGEELSAGHATELIPGAGVLENVLGTSQDSSSVYFVSKNILTVTPSPQGEAAQPGQPNLYFYQAGTIKLVAVLSEDDASEWVGTREGRGAARVSPDGRWLAFMSDRSLTGYDNRDASSGQRDEEVFLYDADGDRGAGGLVCASCNPTGARPHGLLDSGSVTGRQLFDEQHAWDTRWVAANVPAWTSPLYQSRYLSDSGRLFFNSSDALVPSDTNGTEDVYEYEPPGVGTCTAESAVFSSRSNGCVDLISSGTSTEESVFLDASENGDDVFFLTSAQLSRQDEDTVLDVYDARARGSVSEPQPPPACEGDACQSPVSAPTDSTPDSLTYQGPGNLKPLALAPAPSKKTAAQLKAEKLAKTLRTCRKKRGEKRAVCEKQAKQKYGASKAKKANKERGAKS
jgi:hypothetical protein